MSTKKVTVSMPQQLATYIEQLAEIESISQGRYVSFAQLVRRAIERAYEYPNVQISIKRNGLVSEATKGLTRLPA